MEMQHRLCVWWFLQNTTYSTLQPNPYPIAPTHTPTSVCNVLHIGHSSDALSPDSTKRLLWDGEVPGCLPTPPFISLPSLLPSICPHLPHSISSALLVTWGASRKQVYLMLCLVPIVRLWLEWIVRLSRVDCLE